MLRGHSLATVWSKCGDEVTKGSFSLGQSPKNLADLCIDNESTTLREYEGDGFPDVLGTVAELLKRITARQQLKNSFPSEGDEDSVKAWLSAARAEVERITAEHGLADKLQWTVTKLRQHEKVMAILRHAKLDDGQPVPVAVTRGPQNPSQHHDDPYYHAAPAGERAAHYQRILVRERERKPGDKSTVVPFGMDLDSDKFRDHFFGLADGTYLISSRNAYGTTPETQATAAANRAALGTYNTQQGLLRDEVRDIMEKKALPDLVNKALKDVLDYKAHALKTPIQVAVAWRWTTCRDCNIVLVAQTRNHKHQCMRQNCEPKVITPAQFPGLQRILYPHDILGNPTFAPYLKSILAEFNLTSISVFNFLQQNIDLLPSSRRPLQNIPPELTIFIHSSYNDAMTLTLCIDAAYPYLTTCVADPDAVHEDDRNQPWDPRTFDPIWQAIKDRQELHISKCPCRFLGVGLEVSTKHKRPECRHSGSTVGART
ncbi:hypothetical protein BD410DRAFT_797708 [Rickenella mellea]|uniref:Uncharacterized protein n=1 Tax=Rickenella mellea TaxID=50990 RepID=A0A4V3AZG6_9AGAM|nr:hypothetical protein BD410DRAFT_797708 [Rickenella mellea]